VTAYPPAKRDQTPGARPSSRALVLNASSGQNVAVPTRHQSQRSPPPPANPAGPACPGRRCGPPERPPRLGPAGSLRARPTAHAGREAGVGPQRRPFSVTSSSSTRIRAVIVTSLRVGRAPVAAAWSVHPRAGSPTACRRRQERRPLHAFEKIHATATIEEAMRAYSRWPSFLPSPDKHLRPPARADEAPGQRSQSLSRHAGLERARTEACGKVTSCPGRGGEDGPARYDEPSAKAPHSIPKNTSTRGERSWPFAGAELRGRQSQYSNSATSSTMPVPTTMRPWLFTIVQLHRRRHAVMTPPRLGATFRRPPPLDNKCIAGVLPWPITTNRGRDRERETVFRKSSSIN